VSIGNLPGNISGLSLNEHIYQVGPKIQKETSSDLGCKFGANLKMEKVDVYKTLAVKGTVMTPELLTENIPKHGNKGTVRVYRNLKAPFDKKIICFVNSFFWQFFNSYGLSWWLSRLFREYHFVWSPEIDFDYIERNTPEIVLGLAIERFMHKVPAK